MTTSSGPRTPSWLPTLRDVGEAVLTLLTTTVGLAVAVALIDGVRSDTPWAIVLAAVVVAVGDLLLRAPLRFLARRGSAALALGLGLLAQVAVLWLALSVVPGHRRGQPLVRPRRPGAHRDRDGDRAVGDRARATATTSCPTSCAVRVDRPGARASGRRRRASPVRRGCWSCSWTVSPRPVLREAIEAGLAPNIAAVDDRRAPTRSRTGGPGSRRRRPRARPGCCTATRRRSRRSAGGTGTSVASS